VVSAGDVEDVTSVSKVVFKDCVKLVSNVPWYSTRSMSFMTINLICQKSRANTIKATIVS
jgi:hypothetical protein